MSLSRWIWIPLVAVSCESSHVPSPRFANVPPVTAVNDRLDVAKPPSQREFLHDVYHYDGIVQRRLARAMDLPRDRRALGVNSLDEVPDSTWFTNRIGTRDMTIDEVRNGPLTIDSPELHKPWTIKSTKEGGSEVGFLVADARGIKFLLKFDQAENPETETGAHVILDKLFWAMGYNTTEDFVVQFAPDDLVLDAESVVKDDEGHKRKLERPELESRLHKVARGRDGKIRALASRWLAGKTLGGHAAEGVRHDDPNDRIPHELRRDLRGFYAAAAWLDHTDIQEGNFVDAYVTDPGDPKRHYVKHSMIDFGKGLGVMAYTDRDPRRGYAYVIDFGDITRSLITVGAFVRPWERIRAPRIRGVGLFDAASFDPGNWVQDTPAYVPFLDADRFDKFWATKILMRFTREQIRAVVEEARYSDPRATEYITNTIIARQRATGAYWFSRVNPLDRFTFTAGSLCFEDLMLTYELGRPGEQTIYTLASYDRRGHRVGVPMAARGDAAGRSCVGPVALASAGDGYTIVEVTTKRPSFTGQTFVHLARDSSTGTVRVIGIWRT
jgi:hypothetical protein